REQLLNRISQEIAERAQCVLSRHLFAPLIDEVGVVEWSSFDVGSFSGGLDWFVGQRLSDQCGCRFFDLDWRRGDATEHDARVRYGVAFSRDPGGHAQHRKIESTAAA